MSRCSTPVAIIGGGPVGMLLALFLEKHNIASTIFNIERESRWHPKGSTHNSRTMEHYRWIGIADQIRMLGLPADFPKDITYFTTLVEPELTRIICPSEQEILQRRMSTEVTDQVPEPLLRSNQMYVEQYLLDYLKGKDNIDLKYGCEVIDLEQKTVDVCLTVKHLESEKCEQYNALYAVGCDGANSFVRKKLGFGYEGAEKLEEQFLNGKMISGYLKIPDLESCLNGERAWMYNMITPTARLLLISLDGDGEYLLMAKGFSNTAIPSEQEIISLVQQGIGKPISIEVYRIANWTSGLALVSNHFGKGKIFLAGDACHLFSPTGGYGMNTGIDDARNLAWKLAFVIEGWGGEDLLDSYEAERKPIAYRNTRAAKYLTQRTAALEIPDVIYEKTESGRIARKKIGKELLERFTPQFTSLGVELGACYDDSAIVIKENQPRVDDCWEKYSPSLAPGGRLPHLWLDRPSEEANMISRRTSIYDVLGNGFSLIAKEGSKNIVETFVKEAERRGIPFSVLPIQKEEDKGLYHCTYILVRPDHHICWSGNALPMKVSELFDKVLGTSSNVKRAVKNKTVVSV